MQNNSAWVWVTLTVAVFSQLSAFATLWVGNRRWRREVADERKRRQEELTRENKHRELDRQHSINMAWREQRIPLYVAYLSAFERFRSRFIEIREPILHKEGNDHLALQKLADEVATSAYPLLISASKNMMEIVGTTNRVVTEAILHLCSSPSEGTLEDWQRNRFWHNVYVEKVRQYLLMEIRRDMAVDDLGAIARGFLDEIRVPQNTPVYDAKS